MAKTEKEIKKVYRKSINAARKKKVCQWFRENKEELIKVAVSGLFAFAGGLLIGNQVKKANRSCYLKGYYDGIDWASFGCDGHKSISGMDYEYAGYGEFHDCDAEMADNLLKHAEQLGLGENHIKTIKQVIFMEMDKNLPSPNEVLKSKN